mgnify:CR=1 FL=1
MKNYELEQYLNNKKLVEEKINSFIKDEIIKIGSSKGEITGHLAKAEHNLDFVKAIHQKEYADWAVTGCYYACYHAALSLILTKGYSSKNHLATLLVLIKEFYNKELNQEDIETLSQLLDYQDVLFYVESKNKREDATYSTKIKFDKAEVEQLRIKATLFVSKIKTILKNSDDLN